MMVLSDEWPKYQHDLQYSQESRLNTLEICLPRPTSSRNKSRLWILFIHGGAWIDPAIDARNCFKPAQDILLKSLVCDSIAGFASINYRLSPYPNHDTDPSNPSDPARNACHPDHINDILAAILHLQETYAFGDRYVLAGHSCGATLALQVAMKRYWGSQYESTLALELNVVPPVAIVGLAGLYDLPELVAYHDKRDEIEYRWFVGNAFGTDESVWRAASPTSSDLESSWDEGQLVVIAHSHDDELVEWEQAELMQEALQAQGFKETGNRRSVIMPIKGKHDEMWQDGVEVARAIETAVKEVNKLDADV